jgi:hypothetical protein
MRYQPAQAPEGAAIEIVLPTVVPDERQWILDSMEQWSLVHGGYPPMRRDWVKESDPKGRWPRASRVSELFEAEARRRGLRRFVSRRCAPHCSCSSGRHYTNDLGETICEGCFDCRGSCPHGSMGDWVGPSGWQYALQLAGFGS